ncbi:MAG: hypothetical protein ACRD36_08000, partial [Candidatus Acidiferrum sp.]
ANRIMPRSKTGQAENGSGSQLDKHFHFCHRKGLLLALKAGVAFLAAAKAALRQRQLDGVN